MTNGWCDIKNTDVILAMGGNPAENHPVGFKWFIEAKKTRNAKLVAVDPRFTRTAACADYYAPLRPGSDIAFLLGIIRYAIENKRFHEDYVKIHTNGPLLINPDFKFDEAEGVFSGFDQAAGSYNRDSWTYQLDAKGFAKSDPTLQDPNCVFQLLRKHVSRYTPETVEKICGTPKEKFLKVCEIVTSSYPANKAGTITYALGWTQHSTGVQIIRAAAMLQLLLGNVGRPGGGVNAFRGHSNIQGATDMAGTFEILPGYLAVPTGNLTTLKEYIEAKTPKPLTEHSMNYWQNYDKFIVSLLKATYGKNATKQNDWGYDWLPKVDGNYSWMFICDDMYRGNSTRVGGKEPGPEGMLAFGMNPVAVGPNSKKWIAALAKLKWLVVVENSEAETAAFWKAPKDYDAPDASKIQTEVYQLPATGFAEKDGTFTNSARWIQWKWKAVDPPGQVKSDQEILARIFLAVRDLYKKEGGTLPEPVLNVDWSYSNPTAPDLAEALKEINGRALEDQHDPKDKTKLIKPAGEQLDGFAQLQADGTTMCGNWLHSGCFTSAGNLTQRRNNTDDPTGLGMYHNWGFSWPANRRIMYNRASADAEGKPWDPTRPGIWWNGEKWVGDVPDIKPDSPPGTFGAFIMLAEGLGRLFSAPLNDGPFPEHYEPIEAPVVNPLHPKMSSNPASKKFSTDKDVYGKKEDFPIAVTTYRLTEQFHYWTRHQTNGVLNQLQPGFFVEIPEGLAKEKGIDNGSRVKVTSARGSVEGVAMVTKRLGPVTIDGKQVWYIGFPLHWGFTGPEQHRGPLANTATPSAMDPNTWTPEYKAFLVKLEKA